MAQQRKRIIFYLPVVTPWWFANIVVHLIRVLAREHEVHVLVPPLWNNTGMGEEQIDLVADLDHVIWYMLDGPDHPRLRVDASSEEDLIALVRDINPDFVLCRSADIVTPARFPGIVRYIMEGAAPPVRTGANWVTLSPSLFDHGLMPDLSLEQCAELDGLAAPIWEQMLQEPVLPDRAEFLTMTGLPEDKIIIGLPLEYEQAENFFGQHHRYASNAEMIAAIAPMLSDDMVLAVTNHPLNELYGDKKALEAALASLDGKAMLINGTKIAGQATLALTKQSDGMIVGNSKSWSACAAFATPMMRLSDFATGDWVQAYDQLPAFLAAIGDGSATSADTVVAQRWFAFHLANSIFDPGDPALTADDLVSRMIDPVQPERWEQAMARYQTQYQTQVIGQAA
ncbi:MAG: hypothetical protein WBM39_12690 [Parasphingorhabdus sp.]